VTTLGSVRPPPFVSALLCASVAVAAGCHRDDEVHTGAAPSAPTHAAASASAPVDRLAPGELAEGTDTAFGLAIPRDLKVERRFDDSITAGAEMPSEWVANYVRRRVDADKVEIGPTRTVFDRARVKGGAPDKLLRIEVVQTPLEAQLVVRDVTPKPIDPGLSEDERWRKAGLSPNGRPLDPEHSQ
jgi:hypothetical protein